jgi:predicted phage terminase large subunit-like protein
LRSIAQTLMELAERKRKRITIAMPPRFGKSSLASILFPAWYLGNEPHHKFIGASRTADLAVGFSRQIRNLIRSEAYQSLFPGVSLAKDSRSAGHWHLEAGGEFFAIGTGGTISGRGGDCVLLDDIVAEQDALDPTGHQLDGIWDWYTSGPRQRLEPGAVLGLINTLWGAKDVVSRIRESSKSDSAAWTHLTMPAILGAGTETEEERSGWPERWPLEELQQLRRDMPAGKWMCQYQQRPVSEATSLVALEDWNLWHESWLPRVRYIVQGWDTSFAQSKDLRKSNYSACLTWGLFMLSDLPLEYRAQLYPELPDLNREQVQRYERMLSLPQIILLDAFRDRLEFPQLKQAAKQAIQLWQPDTVIIESKSAGAPLVQELRQSGIPVEDFFPVRGMSKYLRLSSVADLFKSGCIWRRADGANERWSTTVAQELAEFPNGLYDDYVDTAAMCLLKLRRGGLLETASDEPMPVTQAWNEVAYYS